MNDIEQEIYDIAKKENFTSDDLISEAECVEEYYEWIHLSLLGYTSKSLRATADILRKERK